MVPPEVLTEVYDALLHVCRRGAVGRHESGQAIVHPMIVAISPDGSQKVCLLDTIEHRIPALTLLAKDPTTDTLVLMYDGYVTILDPATSKGVTRDNVEAYRASAAFPRQDAIIMLTFHRSDPFRFTVDTYRYIQESTGAVLTTPPERNEITLETSPDNDYWVVFDPLTPPVTGASIVKLPES